MPSRKMSSTSTVCAARAVDQRRRSHRGASAQREPRLAAVQLFRERAFEQRRRGTTAPGSSAAYQSITARLAWCSTRGGSGLQRKLSANPARRSTTYILSTLAGGLDEFPETFNPTTSATPPPDILT